MDNKLIMSVLEDQNLTQEQIADIMSELSEIDNGELDPSVPTKKNNISDMENDLKYKLDHEQDWRNRAKLAARIISLGLE